MAITDYKVTNSDISNTSVETSANDTLIGTAQENKRTFDKLPRRIIERYNALVDFLEVNLADNIIDPEVIELYESIGFINTTE